MTRVKLKEQYISYLPLLQTLNNSSVIMLLRTFNIISLILDVRKGDYVITGTGTVSVKFQSTYLKFSLHQNKMQRVFNSSMNYCLMIFFGSHVKETTGKVATI